MGQGSYDFSCTAFSFFFLIAVVIISVCFQFFFFFLRNFNLYLSCLRPGYVWHVGSGIEPVIPALGSSGS